MWRSSQKTRKVKRRRRRRSYQALKKDVSGMGRRAASRNPKSPSTGPWHPVNLSDKFSNFLLRNLLPDPLIGVIIVPVFVDIPGTFPWVSQNVPPSDLRGDGGIGGRHQIL